MKRITLLIFLFLIFSQRVNSVSYGSTLSNQNSVSSNPSANGERWEIVYSQGVRTSKWYQFDATDHYIYFSYSRDNCVDVYDLDGEYNFTIQLPNDSQNGCVNVKYFDDKVYISSKQDTLYIWDEKDCLEILDSQTALAMGYNFQWFSQNTDNLLVTYSHISLLDEDGSVIKQIKTPDVVSKTMPFSNVPNANLPFSFLAIIVPLLFLLLFTRFVWALFRK